MDLADAVSELGRDLREMHNVGGLESAYLAVGITLTMTFLCCAGSRSGGLRGGRGADASGPEAGTPVPTPPRPPRLCGHDASDAETDEKVDPRIQALESNQKRILEALDRLSSRVEAPRRVTFADQVPLSERVEATVLLSGVDRLIARFNAHEKTVTADTSPSGASTAVSSDPPPGPRSPPSSPSPREIERLDIEARNARETALDHLRRYQEMSASQIGGDAKV